MGRLPILVCLLLCHLTLNGFAQPRQVPRYEISGKIIDETDNQPMPMVAVGIAELNLWTVTSMEGIFTLRSVPQGEHVLTVRCLGYNQIDYKFKVPEQNVLSIKMTPASLALGEVVVTSQRGTGISTSTTIGRSAIEHLQPSDITEIMQLLPGQITANPNLSGVSQLGVREVTGSTAGGLTAMASLGTALRIDGAPVSNIANLQTMNSTQESRMFQSTAMQGADMRQLSVDNIESIEVVRGIPGVEEGDALSGVVKVNLVKGRTPLTTRVKIDPNIKQAYVGKGFNLSGKTGGTINTNLDFAQSHSDIRTPYKSYNRLSGYIAYNNTFFKTTKPLTFSFSGMYGDSRSVSQQDPDRIREERLSNQEQNLLLTSSGRWALNSLLLTNLNINISGNIQRQVNYEKRFRSFSSVQTLPISFVTGEFEAPYLMPLYYSEVTVDGRPYYLNASVNGTRTFHIGQSQHTIRVGMDYNLSGNNGKGSMYDILQPPTGTGFRPRPFDDIPALHRIAMFSAAELVIPIGSTRLEMQAGLRFNNIQPSGLFSSAEDITALDPRLNMRYRILEKGSGLVSQLGLRFGYGKQSLTPTLSHIYPDKSYRDLSLFNYYDPPGSLAVIYTDVIEDTRNHNLRAANSTKYEGGLNIVIAGIDMEFTGYYETMKDGFTHRSIYLPLVIHRYNPLTQAGLAPRFIPGTGVVYNHPGTGQLVVVPTTPDSLFRTYSYPENSRHQIKTGLEYEMDFGRVDALHTSFYLNGAYMYSRSVSTTDFWSTESSVRDQIVGLYAAGQGGSINERVVSTLRTVTQIRPLAMVVSLSVQAIWMERNRSIHEDVNGNRLVYTLEPVDDVYKDTRFRKFYKPIAVMHRDGTVTPWIPEYDNMRPYADLIKSYNSTYYFIPNTYKPAFQLNMRLTKELSKAASISFNVNNLTNYRPLQQVKGPMDSFSRRNQPIYFSGELTIRL